MTTNHAVVWMDGLEAHVLMFDREHVESQRIRSRTHHKATGGHVGSHQLMHGRGDSASGHHSPQGGHAETGKAYFEQVAGALEGVHEVLLTGPAQTKDEFCDYCKTNAKAVSKAIVGVVTTDHPTDPQVVALAKKYFLKSDKMLSNSPHN
jgi:hypothetical protein